MRNLEQKLKKRKRTSRSEELKIAMAKDCLFSSITLLELEEKWDTSYITISKYTRKYNFEYFKKQKLNKPLSNQEYFLSECEKLIGKITAN